uniref:G_PROTEIN_RECEP_F1_2 domain-containing protein n=1 Tax=Syphacia muris TaxID=451379 RepID=A0A0N5A9L3_9BILA
MSFYKTVDNISMVNADEVPTLEAYFPNSIIYIILYSFALPPNFLLAYMSVKKGLISSRVKYPTLAIDQWLLVCHNCELRLKSLTIITAICFTIPIAIGIYDLCLQKVILYDFMFLYIQMSPYTTVFIFFGLAPSFFIFSSVCNLLVLLSIVRRQSKSARKQIGRTLNPRQLQHQKGIVYTYVLQAFMPLILATPYYIATVQFSDVFIMFSIDIPMEYFTISEAIIGIHPLAYAVINLTLLRPYRRALKKMMDQVKPIKVQYNSMMISNSNATNEDCML